MLIQQMKGGAQSHRPLPNPGAFTCPLMTMKMIQAQLWLVLTSPPT